MRLSGYPWLAAMVMLASASTLWMTPAGTRAADDDIPPLDTAQADWIGERIFRNECNLNVSCLTSWNAGENFPSLGIGHFIWYREGQSEPFQESFPRLLDFYEQQGVVLPEWIRELAGRDAPWSSREQFLAELDSPRMVELREFLDGSRAVQTRFLIRRMHRSLPRLAAASSRSGEVTELFHRLAHESVPLGLYALIDYINFKGEGTAPAERYQGKGWGLLQVLEHMLDSDRRGPLLRRFADSARAVLRQRVENAPPERDERRWLEGWFNRVDRYAEASYP